ncbi:MAG: Fe-S cluster assembly protein SufD, partial [Verrucomicrobiota bacterium]|nr:Fe-S cluster assembly protein SufD [Verrucomicrobiota bacterium]
MTSTEISSILGGPRQSTAPDWFRDLQAKAWEEFEAAPLPTRGNELWRFSSVKNLALDGYVVPSHFSGDSSDLIGSREFPKAAGRIIFANESLVTSEILDPGLESAGVIFTTLAEALEKHADRLSEYFMSQSARLGSAKFAALHKSLVQAGTFLWVPRGVEIQDPFEVFHLVQGDWTAVFPHTLIIAEDNSRVTFLEHFISANPQDHGLACGVNDLVLKPGSKLNYVSIQEWSKNFVSIQVNSTVAGKDSAALNLALNFGGKYSRLESISRMIDSGARSDMLAVSVAHDEQEFDQRTLQDHQKP